MKMIEKKVFIKAEAEIRPALASHLGQKDPDLLFISLHNPFSSIESSQHFFSRSSFEARYPHN